MPIIIQLRASIALTPPPRHHLSVSASPTASTHHPSSFALHRRSSVPRHRRATVKPSFSTAGHAHDDMMSHHRLGRVVSDLSHSTSRSVTTTDHDSLHHHHHHQSATKTSNNEGGNVGKATNKQKLSLLISSVVSWTRSESSGETAGREKNGGSRTKQQANNGGRTGGRRRRRGLDIVLALRKYVAMVEQLLTSSSYSASSSRPDADRRRPHTFTSGGRHVAGGNADAAHAQSSSKRHSRGRQSSAPASLRGSPATSGHLSVGESVTKASSEVSTMEELQSAIQAAIAHCKNSVAAAGDRQQQQRKC